VKLRIEKQNRLGTRLASKLAEQQVIWPQYVVSYNKFEKVTLQTDVDTSAPPSTTPHRAPVRNRIFCAELMVRNQLKKDAEWRVRNQQNNFRASAPIENYLAITYHFSIDF